MSNFQSLVEGYRKPERNKGVKRNDEAYRQCLTFTTQELERLLEIYRGTVYIEDMRARLLRDSIDHHIRRYHGYAIEGRIGSHYREVGVSEFDCIFEHVIPASSVRDMLIEGRLSIIQALNTPTCLIKKANDTVLRKSGLSKTSPDNWHFFKRYSVLNSKFETYNGQPIVDLNTWDLPQHYAFFGVP
jgi:hypothetical protein